MIKEKLGRGKKAVVCVTELMDHAVKEGNRMFRDTPFADCWYVSIVCDQFVNLISFITDSCMQVDLP